MKERFKTWRMHSFECIMPKELCTHFGKQLLSIMWIMPGSWGGQFWWLILLKRPKNGLWIDAILELDYSKQMTKEQLIEITKKLFETDSDLDFLSKLSKSELETLVAAVRNRVENFWESWLQLIILNVSSLHKLIKNNLTKKQNEKVVLFLVDGLRPDGLGQAEIPHMNRLIDEGAHTLSAHTVIPSLALPFLTSLFLIVEPNVHGINTNTWQPQNHYIF